MRSAVISVLLLVVFFFIAVAVATPRSRSG